MEIMSNRHLGGKWPLAEPLQTSRRLASRNSRSIEKDLWFIPKLIDTRGCMTLGHSNWTICSPLN